MNLTLRKSSRKQAKMKLAIQGASGSGKTYSSLVLAYGITGDWSKVAIIDTENGSSDLYADLGDYMVLPMHHPYSPEMYAKAIDVCVKHGVEVLVIDSLSHVWEYLLDAHSNMTGNSFTNWGKITPRLNKLIQVILNAPIHVIATMRTKQDYVLSEKNGKMVPEKVGLKAIQRDGVDYEFTIVFDIDTNHQVTASKDRTGLFVDKPQFKIDAKTGEKIQDWCSTGDEVVVDDMSIRILETKSMAELMELYQTNPQSQVQYKSDFINRKKELTVKDALEKKAERSSNHV